MGKTYRRTDIKNNGYYDQSSVRGGKVADDVADAIFHSDKPTRWNGLEPEVKSRQNQIARMEKRKIKNRVMSGGEPMYDKTDKTVKAKSNTAYHFS